MRAALLADLDQPYDARPPGPETPRQAAVGAVTDVLAWLFVVALLLWDGIYHGSDGQAAGAPNSFVEAMAPVADVCLWSLPALGFVLLMCIVARTQRS